MLRLLIVLPILFLMSACSTKHPVPVASLATPGAVVETLTASVSMSLRTAEKNIAGRGVMVYRRPDQLRLILLSPLGTTVMETLVLGDQLSLAYPANGVAFQGKFADLPASTGQRGWTMLRWVLESETPVGAPVNGVVERPATRGVEKITLQNGMVIEKTLPGGERVRYRNHTLLAGVWLPLELLMESAEGDRIRLTLEEPEVNAPLEEQAFSLRLQGLRLLPLSELKGP